MVPDVSMPPFTVNLPDVICVGPLMIVLEPVAPIWISPVLLVGVPKYIFPVVCPSPMVIFPVVVVLNNSHHVLFE